MWRMTRVVTLMGLVASMLVATSGPAAGATEHGVSATSFIRIDSLPGEDSPAAINEVGQVATRAWREGAQGNNNLDGALWTPDAPNGTAGSAELLQIGDGPVDDGVFASSSSKDINDAGVVLGGQGNCVECRAWISVPAEGGRARTFIDTFGGAKSWASAVNNDGVVVGEASLPPGDSGGREPFVWVPDTTNGPTGTLHSIADQFPADTRVIPWGLNDRGQIVGYYSGEPDFQAVAFLWTPDEVGALAGERIALTSAVDDVSAVPRVINEAGIVAGEVNAEPGRSRPVVWLDPYSSELPIEIGVPEGYEGAFIAGMNDAGYVVGNASNPSTDPHDFAPWLWLPSGPEGAPVRIDLADLVPEGITLERLTVRDINNANQVLFGATIEGETWLMQLDVPDYGLSVEIQTPADGAVYAQGAETIASYECPGAVACIGPVPSGDMIDTAEVGEFAFTVRATSLDGATLDETHSYTVVENLQTMVPGKVTVGEGGSPNAEVPVTLSGPVSAEVRADWVAIGFSATEGSDFVAASGTVVFGPGETTASVSVSILDDDLHEHSEVVLVRFDQPTNAELGGFHGLGGVIIKDNDEAPDVTAFAIVGPEGDVGDRGVSVPVTLNRPAGLDVTIEWATLPFTANAADFVVESGTLVIPEGQVSAVIEVTLLADAAEEPVELFFLRLKSASGGTISNLFGLSAVTILDDD